MPVTHQRPTTALNGAQLKLELMKAFESLLNSLYKNHLIYPGFQGTITLDSQVMMSQPPTHHGERSLVIDSPEADKEGRIPGVPEGNVVVIMPTERNQAQFGGGVAAIHHPDTVTRVETPSIQPNMSNPSPQSRAATGEPIPMSLSGQPMSAGRHDPSMRAKSLDQKSVAASHGSVGEVPSDAKGAKDGISQIPESTRGGGK
jgi:hypothetical protein